MARWFGKEKEKLTIDELVVLERFDQAESELRARLKLDRTDLRSKVLLADVLVELKRPADAVVEYLAAADLYQRDGFLDKAAAVLAKASKLDPLNEEVTRRLNAVERARQRERIRNLASEVGKQGVVGEEGRTTSFLELQQIWERLADTAFVVGIGPEQIRRLMMFGAPATYASGDKLVEQGAEERVLFIVGSGGLEILVAGKRGETSLGELGLGDIVGEAALFEQARWGFSVVATQRTQVLRLDRAGFERCLAGNPDPRGFLAVLRRQQNDRMMRARASKLGA